MRFFVILFLLISLMPGCSTMQKPVDVEPTDIQYAPEPEVKEMEVPTIMSHEDIVSDMNELVLEEKSAIEEDDDYKKRLDSLIPDGEFLEAMKDLKEDPRPVLKGMEMALPQEVDLTPFLSPVKSQNNGYCTAFATSAALEGTLCKVYGLCGEDISEQYLFNIYRKYNTAKAVEAAVNNLLVDEKYWPKYGKPVANIKRFAHAQITNARYLGSNHDAMMEALARGNFVVVGMKTPKDMLSCRSTIRPTTSFSSGGHAITISGYRMTDEVVGGMYGKIKNSWGSNCGDGGYQYVPFKGICNKRNAYCYYWEVVSAYSSKVSNPHPFPEPKPEDKKPVFKKYCASPTWNPWTWPKKNRCYTLCEKNCSTVCKGGLTCKLPYKYKYKAQ